MQFLRTHIIHAISTNQPSSKSTHIFPSFTIPYLVHEPQIGFHRSFLYITIFYPKKDPVGSPNTETQRFDLMTARTGGGNFVPEPPVQAAVNNQAA